MPKSNIVGGRAAIRGILKGRVFRVVDDLFDLLAPEVNILAQRIVREKINTSPTVLSLLGADFSINNLKIQFGLTDEEAVNSIDKIIDAVINSIKTNIVLYRNATTEFGRLEVFIAPPELQESLAESVGVYISEPSGSEIPWLKWLLTKGLTIVVDDYRVFLTRSVRSRSGGGIMKQSEGSFYRVDSNHAGVIGDNFITRAVEEAIPEILVGIDKLVRQL